jgi:hypothetical protein
MSKSSGDGDAVEMFVAMSSGEKQRFLAVYAHEMTILAREYFLDGEVEGARSCNETIHKLMGFLMTSQSGSGDGSERSFAEMIVAGAGQMRIQAFLMRSMNLAVGRPVR